MIFYYLHRFSFFYMFKDFHTFSHERNISQHLLKIFIDIHRCLKFFMDFRAFRVWISENLAKPGTTDKALLPAALSKSLLDSMLASYPLRIFIVLRTFSWIRKIFSKKMTMYKYVHRFSWMYHHLISLLSIFIYLRGLSCISGMDLCKRGRRFRYDLLPL